MVYATSKHGLVDKNKNTSPRLSGCHDVLVGKLLVSCPTACIFRVHSSQDGFVSWRHVHLDLDSSSLIYLFLPLQVSGQIIIIH